MTLPADSKARKETPIVRGFLDYFPDAVCAVARVSFKSNAKHNPGEPLRWSREKSSDHADAIGRHLLERGTIDPDSGESATAHLAWRAMALLQLELEAREHEEALLLLSARPDPSPLPPIGPTITCCDPPIDEPE